MVVTLIEAKRFLTRRAGLKKETKDLCAVSSVKNYRAP